MYLNLHIDHRSKNILMLNIDISMFFLHIIVNFVKEYLFMINLGSNHGLLDGMEIEIGSSSNLQFTMTASRGNRGLYHRCQDEPS